MKPLVTISVRGLVEFLLRQGDIDDRTGSDVSVSAMQEGARAHRFIQKSMGAAYHAEVPLEYTLEYEDYCFRVEGRADGIIYDVVDPLDSQDVIIDEIKGMYTDVKSIHEPLNVHLAQAKCYAFIFALENNLKKISVQITYVNLYDELYQDINRLKIDFEYDQLEEWFFKMVDAYRPWSDYRYYHRKKRQDSIARLEFPFEYREGQKQLVSDVYRSINRGKTLFIQAPTGVGKTISTVFPAIEAIGQEKAERIFYLTAKTITRTVARDTFALFEKQGYAGKTVEISAREKICINEKLECNPTACPYALGHYDRINEALYLFLMQDCTYTMAEIMRFASEQKVCPYELAIELAGWVDHIICDYNYVFDPNAYLRQFFGEGKKSEAIFLVDEAHNLVERGRKMYSETIVKEEILAAKKWLKPYGSRMQKSFDRLNRIMLEYKKECEDLLILNSVDRLMLAVANLTNNISEFLEKRIRIEEQKEVLEIYFKLCNFYYLSLDMQDDYVVYCKNENDGFAIHLQCIDPSNQLSACIDRANASVFFSATLLPVDYYKKLICTDPNPYAIYANTVFKQSQRLLVMGCDVTTKYTRRGPDTYMRYARYITTIAEAKEGNYMAFFPSYAFMQEVYERLLELDCDMSFLLQGRGMKEGEREEFLQAFENHDGTLVGLCVLGGIFAEGIDLTDDRLIGAIIVGTGLPQVNEQQNLISDYFDERDEDGFSYAYLYPGMNKVMQAAGRVIRTVSDRGVIALLDERFRYSQYRRCFPREWSDITEVDIESIQQYLVDFWG